MTQTTVSPVRGRARVLAFVVAGVTAVSLAYACAQTKRSPGDECLKSEDCLSGVCVQLVCGSSGPLTDTMANNTEAGESDSAAVVDTGSAPDTSMAPETGSGDGGDAASETSSD